MELLTPGTLPLDSGSPADRHRRRAGIRPRSAIGPHGRSGRARHHRHRCRRRAGRVLVRDPPPGSVVLRCAGRTLRRSRQRLDVASRGIARARLRWAHRAHPGLAGAAPRPGAPAGLPGEEGRARRRDLGGPVAARAAALQSRRVHLRRPGRDDEPPHQPLRLWTRGTRVHSVQRLGRLDVVRFRVAVRADLPRRRRRPGPGLGPRLPGRPGPVAAPRGRRDRLDDGGDSHPGASGKTRPGTCHPARCRLPPRPLVARGRCAQRRAHARSAAWPDWRWPSAWGRCPDSSCARSRRA